MNVLFLFYTTDLFLSQQIRAESARPFQRLLQLPFLNLSLMPGQ